MSSADFSSKAVKRNMTRSTGKLNLRIAEQERVRLTATQQKQIQKLYENAAKEIAKKAKQAPRVPSDALRKQYLNQLQNQLNEKLDKIRGEIESTVKDNMKKTAEAVVGDNIDFLKEVGMPIQGAFSHVPDEVVRAVATGQLYEGKWSLSRALWKSTRRTQKDVQSVVAQGIAQNKSAYDIAKDLEKYVDPTAKKAWDWSKVYPGTTAKVDYNAQRLARTMVSHAFQQSFVETTKKNPFVTKYKWVSSGGARTCEICAERDGVEYSKTDLPLDHPNGMCTFIAVIEDSMVTIADRIADWVQGKPDEALDDWASSLTGTSVFTHKPTGEKISKKVSSKPTKELLQEATSIKGINKVFNESKWFTTKTYMNGCDMESARAVGEMYEILFKKYPSLVGKFPAPEVKELRKGVYANCRTTTDGGISLSTAYFSDWGKVKKAYKYDVFIGLHPEGTNATGIVAHEFGHALDGYLGRALGKDTVSSDVVKKALKAGRIRESQVRLKISTYASKNERECFAELFSEYITSENPSKAAMSLGKQIEVLIGGVE